MNTLWAQPPRIIALTGAGLARETGFAPFADLPPGLALDDVLTREGFARDPARVLDFYNRRRRQLLQIEPGAAHEGLAVLDVVRPRELLVVTGNIDDLHERAGSLAVIHLHGELLKARCTICGEASERRDDITVASECPLCGNPGHLRPDIVWVGETPRGLDLVYPAIASAALFLVVGANPTGEPAAGLLAEARRAGAEIVELNRAPLGETVGACVKALIAEA
jgi:NAD-dependent deacetylase